MDSAKPPGLDNALVHSEKELVERWLRRLDAALQSENQASLATLFAPGAYWRDLLAFTWSITPSQSAQDIAALMVAKQRTTHARRFAIAEGRTPPRRAQRVGSDVIEGIFRFETELGRGLGVVRLLAADPSRAFQLMTGLRELKGFEERLGKHGSPKDAYAHAFGAANWKERRAASQAYSDADPAVLVVGAGQAGLSVAATLVQLGVDTLVIDKHERIGDNWRKRYRSLVLHNETAINHLLYMPFPQTWPQYLPKDMLADWFEAYAWAMEINCWTNAELAGAAYDASTARWEARVRRPDGSERVLRPRHLIFANGLLGAPRIPDLPGLKEFAGDVMHSTEYTSGDKWQGKKALVVGTGTSAHDVAQDLHCSGCDTTIIQRGSSTVVSIEPSTKMIYAIYQGIPIEDGDLLASTNTFPMVKKNLQLLMARMVEYDRKIIDGLIARGFKWDMGDENAGHQMKIRTRYGGYYLNAGCSELIINGDVGLLQYDRIERFVPGGALLKDGTIRSADLIVLGTGFVSQPEVMRRLLGAEVAGKVGPVWGLGPDGEMNNMWKRTPQEGLWFVGGSFANCRIYSRYVALQIKAIEEGMLARGQAACPPR